MKSSWNLYKILIEFLWNFYDIVRNVCDKEIKRFHFSNIFEVPFCISMKFYWNFKNILHENNSYSLLDNLFEISHEISLKCFWNLSAISLKPFWNLSEIFRKSIYNIKKSLWNPLKSFWNLYVMSLFSSRDHGTNSPSFLFKLREHHVNNQHMFRSH